MKTCREIEEFGRHQELSGSRKLAKYEKDYFPRILDGSATEVDLTSALERLPLWKICQRCLRNIMEKLLSLSLMSMIRQYRKDMQRIFMMKSLDL